MNLLSRIPANGRKGTISARTIRLTHSVIREVLQHAFEWDMVVRNVADAPKPPRAVRPQVQVWGAEDAQDFLIGAQGDNGAFLEHGNLIRNYNALIKEVKLSRIPFHGLRHTHATLLLKEGINVRVVSERLGHANIGITLDTYAHVLPAIAARGRRPGGWRTFPGRVTKL